jgi:hypothetical protein
MGRTSTGYNPDFDIDLSIGQLGEHLFDTFWEELHRTGRVEVKVDRGAWRTGNHYVETAQSSDGEHYRPSGINVTKAHWWVVASPSDFGFVCVRTDVLKRLCLSAREAEQPIRDGRTNASKGRLVPLSDLMREMLREVS